MRNKLSSKTPRTNACIARLTVPPPKELVHCAREMEAELFVANRDLAEAEKNHREALEENIKLQKEVDELNNRFESLGPLLHTAGRYCKSHKSRRVSSDDPNSDEDYNR